MQELPVARDDEERVVDPDPEADHRHEERCDRVDGRQACEEEKQEERRDDRRDREEDRNRRRHQVAEQNEQEDQRDENADELLRALLNGRELGVAVELRGDPCRRDRVAHRVLDRDHRLAILVVDHPVELRLRVADAPVVGNRAVCERIADAFDAGLVLSRFELLCLQLGESVLDGRLALWGVELLTRRRGEDEVQDATLFGGELRLDQVNPLLRVGAGDLELVAEASAEEDSRREEREEGEGADEHHAPGLVRAHTRPPGERSC